MDPQHANRETKTPPPDPAGCAADPQWGDWLSDSEDRELLDSAVDSDPLWGLAELCDPVEDEVLAPSAAEIETLLSQLAGVVDDDQLAPPQAAAPIPPSPPPASDRGAAIRSIQSLDSLDSELRDAFLDDAASCIGSMEQALLRLESDPRHSDSLQQICRELHTLKGASASVGLTDLADRLHRLEDGLQDDQTAGRTPQIDSLLNSVDEIRSQIAPAPPAALTEARDQHATANGTADHRLVPADPLAATFADAAEDDESVRVKSSQLNRLMDMLAELVMLRNRRATELTELQEIYHELIQSVAKMRVLSNDAASERNSNGPVQLAEVASDVLDVAQRLRHCARPVAEGNTAVSQFIRQFRQELVELRRTPIAGLFRRLQRVVRDAAQAEGKEVRLELVGADAGIERSLQQRLYEPLLHIVRNSVCHGIELPQTRLQAGKRAVGTIKLQAHAGSDLFMIEIHDDGRGLDYDAIRRRGIETGLLAVDQDASREELAQLIFHPGFSTRQSVNQMAGRGVGMDVVGSTLQRMRGWLQVDSQPHRGTRIRLSFPLPSVIQHAMVFRCAGQLFALPMQSVQSAGEVDRAAMGLDFAAILGCPHADPSQPRQPIVLACQSIESAISAHTVHSVTLLVDEIIGPEEVVVRPLPTLLKHHPFCSGATLSGMGETVLVLDARRLVQSQASRLLQPSAPSEESSLPLSAGQPEAVHAPRPRVLVVDDSVTARKTAIRCLSRYPLEIVEACDGKQALAMIKSERFAAVFSDLEMPHISGMELLAQCGADTAEDGPGIVIVSSRGEAAFSQRAKQLGAVGYLVKPMTDAALDQLIASQPLLSPLTTAPSRFSAVPRRDQWDHEADDLPTSNDTSHREIQ